MAAERAKGQREGKSVSKEGTKEEREWCWRLGEEDRRGLGVSRMMVMSG